MVCQHHQFLEPKVWVPNLNLTQILHQPRPDQNCFIEDALGLIHSEHWPAKLGQQS